MAAVVLVGLLVALGFGVFVAGSYWRRWQWTGFSGARGSAERKTLWGWLSLLVVPAALASVVFALDSARAGRDRDREQRQTRRDRAIAAPAMGAIGRVAYVPLVRSMVRIGRWPVV